MRHLLGFSSSAHAEQSLSDQTRAMKQVNCREVWSQPRTQCEQSGSHCWGMASTCAPRQSNYLGTQTIWRPKTSQNLKLLPKMTHEWIARAPRSHSLGALVIVMPIAGAVIVLPCCGSPWSKGRTNGGDTALLSASRNRRGKGGGGGWRFCALCVDIRSWRKERSEGCMHQVVLRIR